MSVRYDPSWQRSMTDTTANEDAADAVVGAGQQEKAEPSGGDE